MVWFKISAFLRAGIRRRGPVTLEAGLFPQNVSFLSLSLPPGDEETKRYSKDGV